jgi:hypothetical protein
VKGLPRKTETNGLPTDNLVRLDFPVTTSGIRSAEQHPSISDAAMRIVKNRRTGGITHLVKTVQGIQAAQGTEHHYRGQDSARAAPPIAHGAMQPLGIERCLRFQDTQSNGLGTACNFDSQCVIGAALASAARLTVDDLDDPGCYFSADMLLGPASRIDSRVIEFGSRKAMIITVTILASIFVASVLAWLFRQRLARFLPRKETMTTAMLFAAVALLLVVVLLPDILLLVYREVWWNVGVAWAGASGAFRIIGSDVRLGL